MYSIPGKPIRLFFNASTLTLKCNQDASSQILNIPPHALAQYHYAHTCIILCGLHHPIEFKCIVTYIVSTISEILQLLLSPVAVYSLCWHHSPSTFFYLTSHFRASSSPKKTAHLHLLQHVIMYLSCYFGQPFRLWVHHDGIGILPPQLCQEQACRYSLTHFNNPVKSRKTPTLVEVNCVEQSLSYSDPHRVLQGFSNPCGFVHRLGGVQVQVGLC